MNTYDTIIAICQRFGGSNLFIGDAIPAKKLDNARAAYPISKDVFVAALLDTTALGSAKTGLAICSDGIYWRNAWSKPTTKNYLSWDDLAERNLSFEDDQVTFEKGVCLGISAGSLGASEVAELLNALLQPPTEAELPTEKDCDLLGEDEIQEVQEPIASDEPAAAEPAVPSPVLMPEGATYSELLQMASQRLGDLQQSFSPLSPLYAGWDSMRDFLEMSTLEWSNTYSSSTSSAFAKKARNAILEYAPEVNLDEVIVVKDSTIWGSAKEGALVTEEGFYFNPKPRVGPRGSFLFSDITDFELLDDRSLRVESNKGTVKVPSGLGDTRRLHSVICKMLEFWEQERILALVEEAVTMEPSKVEAYQFRAEFYILTDRMSDALATYRVALDLDAGNDELRERLAELCSQQAASSKAEQQYEDAEELYQEAVQLKADDAKLHAALGSLYAEQERHAEAVECYTEALRFERGSEYFLKRGNSLVRISRFADAMLDFENALIDVAGNLEILKTKAFCLLALGDNDRLIRTCEEMLDVSPGDSEALQMLSYLYLERKDYDLAMRYLSRDAKEHQRASSYRMLGLINFYKEDYKQAIEMLTEALQRGSDDLEGLFVRAYSYLQTEERSKAIDDFTAILDLDESHAVALYERGRLFAEDEFFCRAVRDFARVSELDYKTTEVQELLAQAITDRERQLKELYSALAGGDMDLFDTIGAKFDSLNAEDAHGITVLMTTVINENEEALQALLERGVFTEYANRLGLTAFDIAAIRSSSLVAHIHYANCIRIAEGHSTSRKVKKAAAAVGNFALDAVYSPRQLTVETYDEEVQRLFEQLDRRVEESILGYRSLIAEQLTLVDQANEMTELLERNHAAALSELDGAERDELSAIKRATDELGADFTAQFDAFRGEVEQAEEDLLKTFIANLLEEKGEFETTEHYEERIARAKERSAELKKIHASDFALVREKARKAAEAKTQEAEARLAEALASYEEKKVAVVEEYRQKRVKLEQQADDERQRQKKHLAQVERDVREKLLDLGQVVRCGYQELELGRYDADEEAFPITIDGDVFKLCVPIATAPRFKEKWDEHQWLAGSQFNLGSAGALEVARLFKIQTEDGKTYTLPYDTITV